ncbi:MAG TPA: bi-functional transferase/deacetylase, partial [Micromonosporaceae bacterium]
MLFLVLAGLLAVEAYANAAFVPDHKHTSEGHDRVPDAVRNGGPILNTTTGEIQSYRLPPRTIAITFDDGPDPKWTP